MAKSRKKRPAKRKPAKAAAKRKSAKGKSVTGKSAKRKSAKRAKRTSGRRKAPTPNPVPKGGGQWPIIFVAVLALLVGIAAGWHVRDSGMAAHAAPGAQTHSAKPSAMRVGGGRQAVDHLLAEPLRPIAAAFVRRTHLPAT